MNKALEIPEFFLYFILSNQDSNIFEAKSYYNVIKTNILTDFQEEYGSRGQRNVTRTNRRKTL